MTTKLSQEEKPETFDKSNNVATMRGRAVGNAGKDAEKELGRPISTEQNYLSKTEKKKELSHNSKK